MRIDVDIACAVWDGSVALLATDISNEGLWVESPYALSEGEELVVSFELPSAGGSARVWAIAEVARVGMWRRRGEAHAPGMGLSFTYCSGEDRARLRAALQGSPPPLPECARGFASPPPLPLRRAEVQASTSEHQDAHASAEGDALPAVLDWLLASG